MEQADKEKLVDKIKKLFALGMKAPETEEAKSAMVKAYELMEKYGLGTIDMEDDGTIKDENILRVDLDFSINNPSDGWERILVANICKAFQCEVVVKTSRREGPKIVILGAKTDIDFVVFLIKYTRLQIKKLADVSGFTSSDKTNYMVGCAMTVSNLVKESFEKHQKSEEYKQHEQSHALVVVKSDAVAKKFKEIFPNVKSGRKIKLNGSRNAFEQGKYDGNKVKINRQVTGNSQGAIK